MRHSYLLIVLCSLVAACSAPVYDRVANPQLYSALDRKLDGTVGYMVGTETKFRIVSTKRSSTRLCRVVTFETTGKFTTKSFCKTKGGEWR